MTESRGNRRRRPSMWSLLSCCSRENMANSIHFTKTPNDSVHVMVKHEKDVAKRRGVPTKQYRPSASLAAIVAASNKRQVDAVEVTEDESSDIDKLLECDGARIPPHQ
mmetsp:Transcript_2739/g.6241  ORF Transcript_2739/g.6241 Transcript_2739/m.6241 type:complete len:108 (+) Transcript_2739:156-479(+)